MKLIMCVRCHGRLPLANCPLRALSELAQWMIRFSPFVAIEPPDALLLDVTGSQRLFGGLDRLADLVAESLDQLHIEHGIAIAPTVGAAWALASCADLLPPPPVLRGRVGVGAIGNLKFEISDRRMNRTIVESLPLDALLHPLPIAALRLQAKPLQALLSLGIKTIGQLMQLPRSSLPSRFGPTVLHRLDQALGRIAEPLVPVMPQSPVTAQLEFEHAMEAMEAIWQVLDRLLQSVLDELRSRGQGARRLLLEFFPRYAPALQKTIVLSRPSRHAAGIFNLLRCAVESVKTNQGFIRFRLSVPLAEPLADEQLQLLDGQQQADAREMDHLLERLRIRLGEPALMVPRLVESHLPEKACEYGNAEWDNAECQMPNAKLKISNFKSEIANLQLQMPKTDSLLSIQHSAFGIRHCFPPRPLHLLPLPTEIGCICSPSDVLDGRPVSFTQRGTVHPLIHCLGPERITGIWWEGHSKTRDYFEVEDRTGSRWWIFRVLESRRWFLHGRFA